MNKIEYEHLKNSDMGNNKIIDSECLVDKKDRTLLYGYTCNKETWHVYIKDEQIHIVVYDFEWDDKLKKHKPSKLREIIPFSNCDFIPNKRLYPETCDFEFCKLLLEYLNQDYTCLPFTAWQEREELCFYGEIL